MGHRIICKGPVQHAVDFFDGLMHPHDPHHCVEVDAFIQSPIVSYVPYRLRKSAFARLVAWNPAEVLRQS